MEQELSLLDQWGCPVKSQSLDCVKAINAYYSEFLRYGRNLHCIIEAAVHDPSCVLANTLAAYQLASKDPAKAASFLAAAKKSAEIGNGTKYERMVFEAVSWQVGDESDEEVAIDRHSELLNEFPKDLVSLKRTHLLCFYFGRADMFLNIIEQVMPHNQDQSYAYGLLAFPLLELGRMAEAEKAAKKGFELNADDIWCQHNLCHIFQYECRFKEAVDFMLSCSPAWHNRMSFIKTHCWWHIAVCYLEGHAPLHMVLEIYDNHILKELEISDTEHTEVYGNALGLLLKIDVRGHRSCVEDRIMDIANMFEDKSSWHVEWNLDILGLWALACKKDSTKSEELLESIKARIHLMSNKKQNIMQPGVKLAEAMYEYGRANYQKAYDALPTDFDATKYKMIGASDEQLDVYNEVWYNILFHTKQFSKAIVELEKAVKKREGAPLLWRLLARAYAEEGMAEASAAAEKADALESAYFN